MGSPKTRRRRALRKKAAEYRRKREASRASGRSFNTVDWVMRESLDRLVDDLKSHDAFVRLLDKK